MKFITTLALLAAPLLVLAQNVNPFINPDGGYTPKAGSPVTIRWTPTTSGTISLYLRSGANSNLDAGVAIATDIPNSGSYTYNVPSSVTRGSDYAFEIRSTQGSNYTPQFVIESSNTVASITNPTSSGSSTATRTSSGTASSSASGSSTMMMTSGSMTTSMTGSSSASGSSTSMSGSSANLPGSTSRSSASFQSASSTATGAAPRMTAAAGVMGLIALGAMAL